MNMKVFCWASSALVWLGACQSDQSPPLSPASLSKPASSTAAQRTTTQADAERIGNHLRQQLHLTPQQAKQISQLTLAQAHEEQLLWNRLADTARQQLRTITLQYDGQMKQLLTASQYRHFAQLRQAKLRRHARVQASAEAMRSR